MQLLTATTQDFDQGASLLYGPPLKAGPTWRTRAPEAIGIPEDALLRMALVTVRRKHLRSDFQIARLEEQLRRRLGGEGCELSRRAPLGLAIALSTPDWPGAYVSMPLPQGSMPTTCTHCRGLLRYGERFVMVDDSDVARPRHCIACVRDEADISEPIEEGDGPALRWIRNRLVALGRLPGKASV